MHTWFISSELHVGCFCPLFDPEIPYAAKMIFRRRLDNRLAHVERHLVHDAHLLGNDFSIADVYLFVVSNWARSVNVDLSPYPGILAHRKRVGARPVAISAGGETATVIAETANIPFIKSRRESRSAMMSPVLRLRSR